MKVKINQLEPNPYRDMHNYPISKEKVKTLVDSIQQTGFWDNILARKQNGKFQIAYGHHRLTAVREVMQPTDEVDIPVKELSDALMLKIMANENMDDWKATPQVIDETVRVTRRFLEEHPEEDKYHGTQTGFSKDVLQISDFLGWLPYRVKYSLERLKMIDDDKVEASVLNELPTERAARNFVENVKKYDIPKEKQRAVVTRYNEKGGGEIGMREAAIEVQYIAPKKKQEYQSEKIIKYESYVAGLRNKVDDLFEDLKQLVRTEKELGEISDNIYRRLLEMSLNTLSKQIEIIIKKQENEKVEFTNSNSAGITE